MEMLLEDYKSITRQLVLESSNITNSKKLSLVDFIEEAEENHLDVILSDPDYVGLTENDKEYIMKALRHGYERGLEHGSEATSDKYLSGIGGFVAGVALVTASYQVYKRFFSKAAKSCQGLSSVEKTSCMNKFKRDGIKAQISMLEKNKPKCSETKDPSKCKKKVDDKIRKLKAKLGEL
jgi:hypothetical protein